MIAGGTIKSIEVVQLINTNCTPSFGQLTSGREGAVGAMLGNTPILCGGGYGNTYFDSCISFLNFQWSLSYSMNWRRWYPGGVQINSTTFWILGGGYGLGPNNWASDSTEFIIQGQTNGVPGPKLPYVLRAMCAVKFSEKDIFVIGGSSNGGSSNEVWIYDSQNEFARNQGPSLNIKRRAHSCRLTNRQDSLTFTDISDFIKTTLVIRAYVYLVLEIVIKDTGHLYKYYM